MPHWTRRFYAKQAAWSRVYYGPVHAAARARARWVRTVIGPPPQRVLELGAGGGQDAVALAALGYEVWAVEQVPGLAQHIRDLARLHGQPRVRVLQADFYRVALPTAAFDAVGYWDGFGIGTDADQRRLLRRIRAWLRPHGVALIEVYTPWHAARSAGHGGRVGRAYRQYAFDGEHNRWLDRWWLPETGEQVTQSLRCYAPADLRLLLEGTGLTLVQIHPGGRMDEAWTRFLPHAALEEAMSYVAVLRPGSHPERPLRQPRGEQAMLQ